jgi:hypothetical protein
MWTIKYKNSEKPDKKIFSFVVSEDNKVISSNEVSFSN